MSYWNYRVVRKEDEQGATHFGIYEVYHDDHHQIEFWTTELVEPYGETLAELREDLA